MWQSELLNDVDKDFLLKGIKDGFNLIDDDVAHVPGECENYISATDPSVYDMVESQIVNEIANGNYIVTDKRPVLVSALGAVPKPGGDTVRLIHDCSRPVGTSLNDLATKASVKYQTLEEAISASTSGCFYAKVDLKSAYRSVRIHPSNYPITGLKWQFSDHAAPTYLYDTRLPFGARKSPAIFHRLTQAVRRFMCNRGYDNIIVYLDDFLIISESKEKCRETMSVLINLLRRLGFAINWSKVEDPCNIITFLGIQLDSHKLIISLLQDKFVNFIDILLEFKDKKHASKKQLQSLAGRLNWACRVVRGGRIYLRRVLNAMNQLKLPHHKIMLSKDFMADIHWWLDYASTFNGTRMLSNSIIIPPVHVDACNVGAGIAFNGDWAYINWAEDWPEVQHMHINFKEVFAIVAAVFRWGHLWCNAKVTFLTDSECAKAILSKGTTQNALVMKYIRLVFWTSVKFDFDIHCVHVRGSDNTLPDTISRLHEGGQFMHLESLLRGYFNVSLHPLALHRHMSSKAIHFLILQVVKWLKLRASWTMRLPTIGC